MCVGGFCFFMLLLYVLFGSVWLMFDECVLLLNLVVSFFKDGDYFIISVYL